MPPTATRLDWLSFTVAINPEFRKVASSGVDQGKTWLHTDVRDYILAEFGSDLDMGDCLPERGRYPYRQSTSGNGVHVFYTPGQLDLLVEITGEGCERLHMAGTLATLVTRVLDNLTRLDICTDIQTDTKPQDFAEMRTNKRQKSHETAVTTTGTTCYIGSRKSDRYCRVYRYAKPHPRADRLRVECVYRGHQAPIAGRTWLECGDEETAARAGNQYGWTHPDWTPKSQEKIDAWRPDRKAHRKLMWYHSQIVPALRGMLQHGQLTLEQVIQDLQTPL